MQRFVSLYTGTSRLIQVGGVNNKLFFTKENFFANINKRYLASKNTDLKKTNDIDTHPDLYKPSTAKEETHVPDQLEGHHQPPETFETPVTPTLTDGAKVWSAQNPGGIHVAPLGGVKSIKFAPTSTEDGKGSHETTVYSTQGKLNIADPFKTHTLQPDASAGKSAEAAAASAFETFAPDTPLTSTPGAEAVFAPKISSTDLYSTTSSPTADFDSAVPISTHQEPMKYETAQKSKVFGGQDTSAGSKKHPNENPS